MATIVITAIDRQFDASFFAHSIGKAQQNAPACSPPDLTAPELLQPTHAITD